jgi:ABC-type dipeptide/oligopeptide/nickel transport system ATPase component
MAGRLLDVKGLKTHFRTDEGWVHAVDGVDLHIAAGETWESWASRVAGKSVTAFLHHAAHPDSRRRRSSRAKSCGRAATS